MRETVRAIIGVVGELLITAGIVLGLYIVWQVWWTSIEAGVVRREVTQEIVSEMPEQVLQEATPEQVHAANDVPPPIAQPDSNGGIGILHVPVWGEDYHAPILDGTTEKVLSTGGAGRYENTALPGEIGNSALAGHRLTRGNPFLHVDKLSVGDSVVVETSETWLVFKVTGDEIVSPTDVDVILPVPRQPEATPAKSLLTLTTCHPVTSRSHRWITYLELSHWTHRNDGVPPELAGMAKAEGIFN